MANKGMAMKSRGTLIGTGAPVTRTGAMDVSNTFIKERLAARRKQILRYVIAFCLVATAMLFALPPHAIMF